MLPYAFRRPSPSPLQPPSSASSCHWSCSTTSPALSSSPHIYFLLEIDGLLVCNQSPLSSSIFQPPSAEFRAILVRFPMTFPVSHHHETIISSSLLSSKKTTHLRFLLSNAEAGSVIGKSGSTINDIQSQSGAPIHLSWNFEYFPFTSDRIIMVSGILMKY